MSSEPSQKDVDDAWAGWENELRYQVDAAERLRALGVVEILKALLLNGFYYKAHPNFVRLSVISKLIFLEDMLGRNAQCIEYATKCRAYMNCDLTPYDFKGAADD